jgi:hypothetical protein
MSSLDDTRSVERQRFFDGQRLFADDLQRIEQFNQEMRWLHNASLHQPGIGNGFAVTGRKGDREVVAGPGYAIDDLGREIVLTGSRTLPVPPVAGDGSGQPQRFVLTAQYPEDADLEEVERRAGVCGTDGAVRLREEPIFCWVPLNPDGTPATDQADILGGRQLVLADAAVRDCRLDRDIGIAQRRSARPPTQPYVACGVEAPTRWADWNPWDDEDLQGGRIPLGTALRSIYQVAGGLTAEIDTRQAGFRTVPCYSARIDGPRLFSVGGPQAVFSVVLDGQLSIVEPTPTGFRVRVIVLAFAANIPERDPQIEALGPVAQATAGGFAVSALMLGSLGTLFGGDRSDEDAGNGDGDGAAETTPVVEAGAAAPAGAAAMVAAAAADPQRPSLAELVGDAWTVGWMGVEG